MATTTPDNIWTPDAGDNYALTTDLAAMADTIQDALLARPQNYRVDLTNSERLALSGADLFEGLRVRTTDTRVDWVYSNSTWQVVTPGVVLISKTTFTAANIVTFTGFSSQFENYQAVFDVTSSTAAGGTIRLRSGATDNSAAQYAYQQQWDNGTTHTASSGSSITNFPYVPVAGSEHSGSIDFFGPFTTRPTRVAFDTQMWTNSINGIKSTVAGRHNVGSSFDGFSFTPSAGTITGTLSVYGRL